MQRGIAEREVGVPEDRRIQFRIGINLDDIIIDGNDILGDGVNIAARLEGLAEPGGICVSDLVHQSVAGKFDLGFDDLGERSLKNIAKPLRCFAVRFGPDARQTGFGRSVKSARTERAMMPLWICRLRRVTIALVLLIGLMQPASADFNHGMNAFSLESYTTALREWRSAARAGDARAQHAIGYLYLAKKGVSQDFAEAHKWFEIAAANLPPGEARGRATRLRDLTAGKLSSENYKRVHQAALDWLKKYK